ncbi:hypothetical protein CEXT_435441 [Caerostris extrusa]|uniref:Uncharacterized protein n=1 Tax=Caerostris extrusa TaxID=172846 RepID=A0AAV4NF74_CAEEX|nr:hypothetical protein CEXT_435441 [Caerostris extrusa]
MVEYGCLVNGQFSFRTEEIVQDQTWKMEAKVLILTLVGSKINVQARMLFLCARGDGRSHSHSHIRSDLSKRYRCYAISPTC